MKIWKIVLFAVAVLVTSCVVQQPKPKIQITHVLAVTQEGDTLKLPIDVVRPINYRIINYGYSRSWYPYYHPYPHNHVRSYDYSYSGSSYRGSNNSSSNAGSSKNSYGQTPNPKSVPSTDRSSNSATIKEPRK